MAKTGVHSLLLTTLSTGAILFASCRGGGGDADLAEREWQAAQQKWKEREVDAFSAWTAVDESTGQGKSARKLLREADVFYRKGIALLREKEPETAFDAFRRGAKIAPIDPKHYLTLARMYESEELPERAAKYYAKFAAALPDSAEAKAAREAARKIDPGLEQVFDPPSPQNRPSRTPDAKAAAMEARSLNALTLAGGSFLLGIGILTAFWLFRSRFFGGSLARLIEKAPELHSAVAYLVGSLRHELLKHRVGVAGDVIREMESGKTTGPQRAFLRERLFQGVPLDEAWRAHLDAMRRVLGPEFNPNRDSMFRKATGAITRIQALSEALSFRSPKAIRALSEARRTLMSFDKQLARLQSKLVRTRIDTELFEQIVAEVRGEYAAGAVALDDLRVEKVLEEVYIETPRGDLVLIVKNVLRNAVMAVGKNAFDRKIQIGMSLSLEPTGQEIVRISVFDTSPKMPSDDALHRRGPDSGLGLVMLAVTRYGGVFEIHPAAPPYQKEASIRFFRAFPEADPKGEEP